MLLPLVSSIRASVARPKFPLSHRTAALGCLVISASIATLFTDNRGSIHKLQSSLCKAELNQLEYLLTNEPMYMESYREALLEVRSALSDRTIDTASAQRLEPLVNQKTIQLDYVMALHNQGRQAEALRAFDTPAAVRLTNAIDSAIDRLPSEKRTPLLSYLVALALIAAAIKITMSEGTQRTSTEDLRRTLNEKDTLLKEVHHRVKNNLQVVSSLLRMQSRLVTDPTAAKALYDSQQRVLSMSLIHERLYGSQWAGQIDFAEYARALVNELFRSYGSANVTSRVTASPVRLNIDQAIPCGLILNELVTNSLKYAYPEGQTGELRIELCETTFNEVVLKIADNGVGLPENFDLSNSKKSRSADRAIANAATRGNDHLSASARCVLHHQFLENGERGAIPRSGGTSWGGWWGLNPRHPEPQSGATTN